MRGRASLAAIATACAALAVVPGVASAGTLDQQQTNQSSGFGVGSGQSVAQTFTAGITGDLDGVDLALQAVDSPASPLTVEIRSVIPGSIGATALASAIIQPGSLPTADTAFVAIPLATQVPVSAGSSYAIVLYTAAVFPHTYAWGGANSDVYAGGTALLTASSPPNNTWTPATDDQAFKTYVVPASSPTPPAAPGPTGIQAAALKKCKKKKSKQARKKCKKKARKLPV
jgi:hypothetical protein